ncbi:Zinc finger, SWIM-type [Sesbania bispinosa]|nr:Zinc finger, SWIM-type [Sesbania bispinosa]
MDDILDLMNGKDIPMMDRDTPFWQDGSEEQSFIYASPSLVDQDSIDGFLVGERGSCVVLVDADWDDNQNEGDKDTGYEEDHQNDGNDNTEHGEENRNEGHKYTEHEEETQHKGDQDTEHEEENQNEGDENNEHEEVVIRQNFERMWTSTQDSDQMNNMLKVGIGPPQIFGSFANCLGEAAVKYLHDLGVNDPLMFTHHTIDPDNRLEHLFWCDGKIQLDYKVFGDVLAFDATYVANETEETYIWQQRLFLEAMKGKMPSSVITDGDLAMRNGIKVVFPKAHHRLCAWHLARNVTSNFGIPAFIKADNIKVRREMKDDFSSIHGDPVLQTNLQGLERDLYSYSLYTVCKRGGGAKAWNVSYNPSSNEFKCPCMWLESRGLPCVHTIAVLDHLNINELPKSLVLKDGLKEQMIILLVTERHKGSVRASTSTRGLRVRSTTKCSICHVTGHNKVTCQRVQRGHTA